MLTLIPNDPLDLDALGALLHDRDDLVLVWPEARFPFDHKQWHERLSAKPGNRSFFVASGADIVGHAALLETEEPGVLAVSYLFIRPDRRGQGLGRQLMTLLEAEARKSAATRALRLRVRTYNPRAAHIYESSGFVKTQQDGTLMLMRKAL